MFQFTVKFNHVDEAFFFSIQFEFIVKFQFNIIFQVIVTVEFSIIKLSKVEVQDIFHLGKIFLQTTQVKLFVTSRFSKLVSKVELIFRTFKNCQFQFQLEANILEVVHQLTVLKIKVLVQSKVNVFQLKFRVHLKSKSQFKIMFLFKNMLGRKLLLVSILLEWLIFSSTIYKLLDDQVEFPEIYIFHFELIVKT